MSPCFLAQWCKAMNGGQLIFKMLLKDKKKDDFRRMFCEYYPKLVRFAVQLTGDADERLLSRVEDVAEGLGEPARSIVRLCYYEHLTRRQAAERLGISYDTVKKHIAKALKLLREAVGKGDEL